MNNDGDFNAFSHVYELKKIKTLLLPSFSPAISTKSELATSALCCVCTGGFTLYTTSPKPSNKVQSNIYKRFFIYISS